MSNQEAQMEQVQLQAFYTAQGLELSLAAYPDPPHPIYTSQVPGGEAAVSLWRRLRALTDETGFWPLLIADQRYLRSEEFWFTEVIDDLETEDWLTEAGSLTASAFFAARRHNLPSPDDEVDEWAEFAEESGVPAPEYKPLSAPLSLYDRLAAKYYDPINLVLVPTRKGYEAAAYLGFGGWNECPEPAWQVAIQRDWYERYGAEPIVMSGDVLEMAVARPPHDEEHALALAKEQFLYCDDIVHQGVMTIDNLKQSLIDSPYWYFWWD